MLDNTQKSAVVDLIPGTDSISYPIRIRRFNLAFKAVQPLPRF
jgi:hypothetical protein